MAMELFPQGCPACESKSSKPHCVVKGTQYVQCSDCGLIYQTGTVTNENMMVCYTGGTFKNWRRKLLNKFRRIERQRDFDHRMKRARKIFSFSTKQVGKSKGAYLDIGCNKGFNLYAADENGWEAHGNEIVPEILLPIKNSKPSLKSRIKVGSFVELAETYPDNYFDVITCIDVIEHLTDPKNSMKNMLRILKPGGQVIFQTPNANEENLELRDTWAELKPNEHLLIFNQKNFATVAKEIGYSDVQFFEPFDAVKENFLAVCRKN